MESPAVPVSAHRRPPPLGRTRPIWSVARRSPRSGLHRSQARQHPPPRTDKGVVAYQSIQSQTRRGSEMSKERQTVGTDGLPLPILPPERDARVWARLVRIMFYTPGFMGLLLIKTGEPASFGITIELLMLSSAAAIVGGLFVGAESSGARPDDSSSTGVCDGRPVVAPLAAH